MPGEAAIRTSKRVVSSVQCRAGAEVMAARPPDMTFATVCYGTQRFGRFQPKRVREESVHSIAAERRVVIARSQPRILVDVTPPH